MNFRSVVNVMLATAIAYGALLILMLSANFIFLQSADPERYLGIFAYIAFYAGAVICGYINAKRASSGIGAGVAAGILYIAVIFLFSLLFEGERAIWERLIINIAAVAAAGGGGYLAANKKPKRISPAKNREAIRKKYMKKRV
ncbi:MAG: TIGR04086 family membrane protein [Eubacteriales bacterium]|nr:TIGR04086 family membrane protein [Eubacteriales bacterium]